MADFSEDIGDTQYQLHRTDSRTTWIGPGPTATCPPCAGISSRVLSYEFNEQVIVGMRQIETTYSCAEGHLATETKTDIVFEYIDLNADSSHGPFSSDEFSDIVESNPVLFDSIDFVALELFDYPFNPPRGLRECTNPEQV